MEADEEVRDYLAQGLANAVTKERVYQLDNLIAYFKKLVAKSVDEYLPLREEDAGELINVVAFGADLSVKLDIWKLLSEVPQELKSEIGDQLYELRYSLSSRG